MSVENGKRIFYSEVSYVLGILSLAFGTALMERADFGMSMVVAPAYLVYRKVAQTWSFFTFGMAEYCVQAAVLVLLAVVLRKWKIKYLFSFATTVFYGLVLDLFVKCIAGFAWGTLTDRILLYCFGMLFCTAGVSMLFHTYIAQAAYELFVKEIADTYHKNITTVKTVYDCCSCLLALGLSFAFFGFGHFEGVKWGTILCALLNGACIGLWSRCLEHFFEFQDFRKSRPGNGTKE